MSLGTWSTQVCFIILQQEQKRKDLKFLSTVACQLNVAWQHCHWLLWSGLESSQVINQILNHKFHTYLILCGRPWWVCEQFSWLKAGSVNLSHYQIICADLDSRTQVQKENICVENSYFFFSWWYCANSRLCFGFTTTPGGGDIWKIWGLSINITWGVEFKPC